MYRKADGLHGGQTEGFAKFAAMEDGHKTQFENMPSAAQADGAKDLQAEGAMYLEAIASGYRVDDILRTGSELAKSRRSIPARRAWWGGKDQ